MLISVQFIFISCSVFIGQTRSLPYNRQLLARMTYTLPFNFNKLYAAGAAKICPAPLLPLWAPKRLAPPSTLQCSSSFPRTPLQLPNPLRPRREKRPGDLDLLILKVVSESRVWATSVSILVFLGLSVLDWGPMYTTNRRQTASITLCPCLLGAGDNSPVSVRMFNFCTVFTEFFTQFRPNFSQWYPTTSIQILINLIWSDLINPIPSVIGLFHHFIYSIHIMQRKQDKRT